MIYSLTATYYGEKEIPDLNQTRLLWTGLGTITELDWKESQCKYLPHEHNSSGNGYFPAWMEEKMSRQIYLGAAIK